MSTAAAPNSAVGIHQVQGLAGVVGVMGDDDPPRQVSNAVSGPVSNAVSGPVSNAASTPAPSGSPASGAPPRPGCAPSAATTCAGRPSPTCSTWPATWLWSPSWPGTPTRRHPGIRSEDGREPPGRALAAPAPPTPASSGGGYRRV